LLDQELTIVRLQEDLKYACLRAKDFEDSAIYLQKQLDSFLFIDDEEKALETKLRKEQLKAEISSVQLDKQKEAEEVFDVKPKKFVS